MVRSGMDISKVAPRHAMPYDKNQEKYSANYSSSRFSGAFQRLGGRSLFGVSCSFARRPPDTEGARARSSGEIALTSPATFLRPRPTGIEIYLIFVDFGPS
jgi:hypothetical protein